LLINKMKKLLYIFTLVITLVSVKETFSQDSYMAGANANYYIPLGTLSDRYKPAMGESFYFGKDVSENWTWVGKLEYCKFDDMNMDKLVITRRLTTNGPQYKIPLSKINISLEEVGLTANASYHMLSTDIMKADIELGFGIYRWKHTRADYKDSVYVDTTGKGDLALEEYLNVPGRTEEDWSGGLNVGFSVDVNVYKWASVYASASYKMIIGELWPALSLDLENVSGMQMIELRAGIRARF